jgi:hypothetical protein
MSVHRIIFHVDEGDIPEDRAADDIHVLLYGSSPAFPGTGSAGRQLLDLASRFGLVIRNEAFDFLSITLAVTAADTFVKRESAEDGWGREFEIVLPLANPDVWQPVRNRLEATLRFLSGDMWTFHFDAGGIHPPQLKEVRRRKRVIRLDRVDCACLFSGGLDSAIGAFELLEAKRRPLLVSHAYGGDKKYQEMAARLLQRQIPKFGVHFYPTWNGADDDSMRTRSMSFLGLGTMAATAISQFRGNRNVDLYIPENGFIALNAPLTPRRIGTHSTRTAHQHFLGEMQGILDDVGLLVTIRNPYRHSTKGEMVRTHSNEMPFKKLTLSTVSCGKWKRHNQQCGCCVPCLVRRASFHAAKIRDTTDYEHKNLAAIMGNEDRRDDLISVMSAITRAKDGVPASWVLQSGPLPEEPVARAAYIDVFQRGLTELEEYLTASNLI